MSTAYADDDPDVEEVEVVGEAAVDTATARSLDRDDIVAFPASSADELLRAVPGMQVSSHGGTGKALQFLVRGFDAEHGTDLLVTVEGVVINEPSNVHGQGYVDLAFLPLVLVQGLDVVKGSYRARDGDFAVTGAADFTVGLASEGTTLATRFGSDRSGGGTAAWRPRGARPGTFLVAEADGAVGVGQGRRFDRLRAAVGYEGEVGRARIRALGFAVDGAFESPGVLRSDDLESGEVGFFEGYGARNGGASRRVLGITSVAASGPRGGASGVAWAGARGLSLDQDYTGFLDDEVRGDATRQAEAAWDAGARAEGSRLLGGVGVVRAGLDLRAGAVALTEDAIRANGSAWTPLLEARTRQLGAGGWGETRLRLGPATLTPAMRLDQVVLWAQDTLAGEDGFASSSATVVSPRATASVDASDAVAVFAAAGRGFRSPDARGVADGDRAPVVRDTSGEVGARLSPGVVTWSTTAFGIDVSNELLFDHLAGRFLSAGRTRRVGVESVLDLTVRPWLRLQGDATATDARFVASGLPVPYAPRVLLNAAAYATGADVAGAQLTGGVRVGFLGQRPLPSGFASQPSLVGTVTTTVVAGRVTFGVDVDNLFFTRWRDGEFVFPSWFDRSSPRSELPVVHVTAGDPFAVRGAIGLTF